MTEERIRMYAQFLDRYKPRIVRGYASAVHLFVKYCLAENIRPAYTPMCVILTSDKIYEGERQLVADFFGTSVYDEYGCREMSIMAHECEAHAGAHLAEEIFIFEVKNSTTTPQMLGKGEIIVTPLHNYAFPLLRYCLGDEVEIVDDACKCGRTLRRIASIQGRISDYVLGGSGRIVYGDFFAHMFCGSKSIQQYQIQQENRGRILLLVVKSAIFEQGEMDSILAELGRMFGDDLVITTQYVPSIDTTKSGKRRSVVSRLTA